MTTSTPAIHATLRPLDLGLHEAEVELAFPHGMAEEGAVLSLPAWTPGSYLVRDYARFLDRLRVVDGEGRPVPFEKLDKQRWRIAPAQGVLTVTYRLFCNELTVRTNHLDATHAHFVGAATFLRMEGREATPWHLTFPDWPRSWRAATALRREGGAFHAPDFDTLVDSPVELGTFHAHTFQVRGCEFLLAVTGHHAGNEERIAEATRAIVDVCAGIFGGFPFQRYVFLLTFSPRIRGGLEHRDSTSLLADPHALERPEGYWDLFTLIAHEFFHVWNVKRMRDAALLRFDYGAENYTRLLWFHEGCTSFLQYSLVLRAGCVPWSWVARKLGGSWTDNTTRAGRLEQSLEESSFDAWIRHYKPSEFSTNSTVSYYDRGAMVAWMMDAELRLATGGSQGLPELFASLWKRLGDGPVMDEDLRSAFGDLVQRDPGPFWDAWIAGRAELEPGGIERAYGLRLVPRAPWELLQGHEAEDPEAIRRARAWSGLAFQGASAAIHNVVPGSPAAAAGLGYGMEILAVDGWRTSTAQDVTARIGDASPGDRIPVLAADRGRVGTFQVTVSENPQRTVQVHPDSRPTAQQKAAFQAWTGQPFPLRRA